MHNVWVPVYNFIIASLVLLLCCFCAAWLGAAGKMRALTRRTLDLEYRLEDLEGRVIREVKIRAGEAGRKQKDADQALIDFATNNQPATVQPAQESFADWRRRKMIGK